MKYCDEWVCRDVSVCLFVSLSALISQIPDVKISRKFLYLLPVAVARSFSDTVGLCYVLPVLWITSYFQMIGVNTYTGHGRITHRDSTGGDVTFPTRGRSLL